MMENVFANIAALVATVVSLVAVVYFMRGRYAGLVGSPSGRERGTGEMRRFESSEAVHRELSEIKSLVQTRETGGTLGREQQTQIVEAIRGSLSSSLTREVLQSIYTNYGTKIIAEKRLSEIRGLFETLKTRLDGERDAQARRAIMNLYIGIGFALLGLGLLGWFSISANFVEGKIDVNIANFSVRFSFVVLIEILAYFFLGLYKTGLQEIKYFQNEITNVESWTVAFEGAFLGGLKATQAEIIKKLAATERNFVLKKGEATVPLRQSEFDANQNKALTDALVNLANLAKRKGKDS